MYVDGKLLIGKNDKKEVCILPNMANRHGLISGASGTGKTITAKVMAESFSDLGVPVFLADVKGDIEGTALEGEMSEAIQKRVDKLGLKDFEVKGGIKQSSTQNSERKKAFSRPPRPEGAPPDPGGARS